MSAFRIMLLLLSCCCYYYSFAICYSFISVSTLSLSPLVRYSFILQLHVVHHYRRSSVLMAGTTHSLLSLFALSFPCYICCVCMCVFVKCWQRWCNTNTNKHSTNKITTAQEKQNARNKNVKRARGSDCVFE